MGVTTGWGGGISLVRAVGYSRAMDLLLSGRKIDFDEGLSIGYFSEKVSKVTVLACPKLLILFIFNQLSSLFITID